MQKLLPGMGPYRIPTGNRISAKKVVHFLLYRAYASFPIPKVRRARLREVVDGFYERLLGPITRPSSSRVSASRWREAHADLDGRQDEQAFIEEMHWDGALDKAKGSDYLTWSNRTSVGTSSTTSANNRQKWTSLEGDDAHVSTLVTVKNDVFLPQPRSMGDSGELPAEGPRPIPSDDQRLRRRACR